MDMNAMMSSSMTVLTKPSVASFQSVKGRVNTMTTVVGLVVVGAIGGLLIGLLGGVGQMVTGLIIGAIVTPIVYYIGQVILWVIARVLGGKGDLQTQANLVGTFYVPLYLLNIILNLIPVVGTILALLVGLYELVLLTFGLQAAHAYTILRAVLTWLVIVFIVAILAACFLILLGPQIANIYSTLPGQ